MRLTDEQIAAIKAAVAKMSPSPWTSEDNAMGAWIVWFDTDNQATVDRIWFGDMENNTGHDIANADGIALLRNNAAALLADLEEARAALRWIAESPRALNVEAMARKALAATEEKL